MESTSIALRMPLRFAHCVLGGEGAAKLKKEDSRQLRHEVQRELETRESLENSGEAIPEFDRQRNKPP